MDFLEKIRKLPLEKRKQILWAVVAILSVSLLGWWFNNFSRKMKEIKAPESFKNLQIDFKEEFKDTPKIEIPAGIIDEIKKLEEE